MLSFQTWFSWSSPDLVFQEKRYSKFPNVSLIILALPKKIKPPLFKIPFLVAPIDSRKASSVIEVISISLFKAKPAFAACREFSSKSSFILISISSKE